MHRRLEYLSAISFLNFSIMVKYYNDSQNKTIPIEKSHIETHVPIDLVHPIADCITDKPLGKSQSETVRVADSKTKVNG